MAYSAQAFYAAHVPWTFTDRKGCAHAARDLSGPEALVWLERFQWAGADPWKQTRVISRLFRRLYPWRPRYLWGPDPWREFQRLPVPEQATVIQDFFGRAGLVTPPPRPPTPTTPSPR